MAGSTEQTPFEVAAALAAARLAAPLEEREPRPDGGRPAGRPGSGGSQGESSPSRSSNGAAPAQDLEAERAVLGALMLSRKAFPLIAETGISAGDFFLASNGLIFQAAVRLYDAGVEVDATLLAAELEHRGQLADVGGRVRIHEIAALVPVWANAAHYAEIVVRMARRRDLEKAAMRLLEGVRVGMVDERLRGQMLEALEPTEPGHARSLLHTGGSFILDTPVDTVAVWGDGEQVAWAQGEGTMLFGPQGVGKTTIAQQLALARCGLRSHVLGLPVAAGAKRTLYLAADRPAQAARSLRRMVAEHNRSDLDERLVVHRGPPATLVTDDPRVLARLCAANNADTLVIDSLKDIGKRIAEDESGSSVNLAYQYLVAAGIELLVLHHPRKAQGDNKRPNTLDDVYGSTWLTAGLGSVFVLWGQAGDLIVDMYHLKQPNEPVGPWSVTHDHAKGLSTITDRLEPIDAVYRAGELGTTVQVVAGLIHGTDKPSKNELERVRRALERLVDEGKLIKTTDPSGTRYFFAGPGWDSVGQV